MQKIKKDSGQANSRPDGAAGMTTSMLSTGKPEEAKYIRGDTDLTREREGIPGGEA